jgi:DNA-binding NarL/FixJ family response regulator
LARATGSAVPTVKGGDGVSSVRVVVVDDYAPFRSFFCSTLRKNPELQIVAETGDGLEAVQKAEELQPDLIVLDLGLPTLNGIEAARRIRKVAPRTKILFVSQESSADVVEEALTLGSGYMVKAYAGSELLAAVKAVLQRKRFMSAGVSGAACGGNAAEQRLDCPDKEAVPPLIPGKGEIPSSQTSQERHKQEGSHVNAYIFTGPVPHM